MLSNNVKLTAKDILEKDFKTSMRGYHPDEVDQFLDLIIKDYEAFHQAIEELQKENLRLKKQTENVRTRSQSIPTPPPAAAVGSTNLDILQRLSKLESHVFGDKLYSE